MIFVVLAFASLLIVDSRARAGNKGLDPDKLLVFVGTLVGSITGYYFGGERTRRSSGALGRTPQK
ncbi:MAG TPA: hypothetical protein VG206_26155 [Terriglobia bacterium]|nr:hypothetical protein [Terriglobia bacterium]